MALTFIGNNANPAYLALSSDIVDDSIAGATLVGRTIWLTDTQAWKVILQDLTLGDYEQGTGGSGGASTFVELTDVPSSYTGQANKLVSVKGAQDGLEFVDSPAGVDEFTELLDVPSSYTGQAGKIPAVNGLETELEFINPPTGVDEFTELTDVPSSYSGQAGKIPTVNVGETALEFQNAPTGVDEFIQLSDVPASYSGQAGKIVAVKGAEDGLEFITSPAGGKLIQKVGNVVSASTSTGTNIPYDDSIPQSGEGAEFLSQAITPTNAAHTLYIDVTVFGSGSGGGTYLTIALFKDSDADALAADSFFLDTGTASLTLSLQYKMTAGSTSAITFKVRCGANSGTFQINGRTSTGRIFGGVAASSITIEEVS